MAWTYLAASADFPWPWRHGCGRPPIVKSNDTRKRCYSPEWLAANCRSPLYGMTSLLLAPIFYPNPSTLFRAASPVRILALRALGSALAVKEAAFFSRSCAWPKKSDPNFYFLKMSPQFEQGGLTLSAKNWPASATIASGVCYPLKTSARTTSASGGSVWPTPLSAPISPKSHNQISGRWRAKMAEAMAKWPTPRASDGAKGGPNQRGSKGDLALPAAVWRTPMASDGKDRGTMAYREQRGGQVQLQTQIGGSLNPPWVEWLMGYPIGWTELGGWVTPWYRCKRGKRLNT